MNANPAAGDSICLPLATKLAQFAKLAPSDVQALEALCRNECRLPAGRDLIQEGDSPDRVFLLLEGWAFRYKFLPDGRRQIMAVLVPGDLCDI